MLKMSFKKLIFHATSSREYKMFLSVSHSVHLSWFFLCQHNFSKTAVQNSKKLCSNDEHNMYICIFAGNSNRISGNFLVMKDTVQMHIFAKTFDYFFFSWNYAPFDHRNLAKIEYTIETVFQRNSFKPFHKTSCYFIVKVEILCTCAYCKKS